MARKSTIFAAHTSRPGMTTKQLLPALALWAAAHTPPALAGEPDRQPATAGFKIEVEHMRPTAYRSRTLDAGYTLEVRDDSVFCHLPYVGQAYAPHPVNWAGLEFSVPVRGWEVHEGKKGSQVVSFRCTHGASAYSFRVTLWPGGRADIDVTPATVQRISYAGQVVTD